MTVISPVSTVARVEITDSELRGTRRISRSAANFRRPRRGADIRLPLPLSLAAMALFSIAIGASILN